MHSLNRMARSWSQMLHKPPSLRAQNWIAALFLALFFVHSFASVRQVSLTYDENQHYKFGVRIFQGNAKRFKESVMPVSAWNALPQALATALPAGSLRYHLESLTFARLMTVLFACAIGYLLFHFSRLLYGFAPALLALFLFIFDPNILAHSQLITTDFYVTGALLLVTFCAWRLALARTWTNRFLFAASLAFAQITKYTAISFLPVFFLVLLVYDLVKILKNRVAWPQKLLFLLREYLVLLVLVVLASILVLNVAYLGKGSFTPYGEYHFKHSFFAGLQKDFPMVNTIPVPIPYAHLQGLDWIFEFERTGKGHGNHYLLGEIRTGRGFPGYYIIAFFLKEPFPSQIILLAALAAYFLNKNRSEQFWQKEWFLIFPLLFYTLYFNFFYNSQIGIRYYLIVFPLLFAFAGSLLAGWRPFSYRQMIALAALMVYLVISVFSYYPYYISYFNESIWDRRYAYLYLADSNLDWGQGRAALKAYLAANPQADFEPATAKPGQIIVSPNALVGVLAPLEKYAWLRQNFSPSGTIADEYLIYNISQQEFDQKCALTRFCK